MVIHDGPVKIVGQAKYEADSDDRTTLRLDLEFTGMDASMDTSIITGQIQQSLQNIKRLIESEM